MIRGIGDLFFLDLFSNFKWARPRALSSLNARRESGCVASGPFLVSRTGDAGCTESVLKESEW
jgi:hypothetical protein